MRTGFFAMAAIVAIIFSVINAQRERNSKLTPQAKHVLQWYQVQTIQLNDEAKRLLKSIQKDEEHLQQQFLETRRAYKRMELLLEFFSPATARAMNAPDKKGFPAMEEMIFPHVSARDTSAIRNETLRMLKSIEQIKGASDSLLVTDAALFEAMHQEILRVMALDTSGYDAPVARFSLEDAKASLAGIKDVWLFYQEGIEKQDPKLADHTRELFTNAKVMLDTAKDLNSFSRMQFIREILNPLTENLKLSREALKIAYTGTDFFPGLAVSNAFSEKIVIRFQHPVDAYMRGNNKGRSLLS